MDEKRYGTEESGMEALWQVALERSESASNSDGPVFVNDDGSTFIDGNAYDDAATFADDFMAALGAKMRQDAGAATATREG